MFVKKSHRNEDRIEKTLNKTIKYMHSALTKRALLFQLQLSIHIPHIPIKQNQVVPTHQFNALLMCSIKQAACLFPSLVDSSRSEIHSFFISQSFFDEDQKLVFKIYCCHKKAVNIFQKMCFCKSFSVNGKFRTLILEESSQSSETQSKTVLQPFPFPQSRLPNCQYNTL